MEKEIDKEKISNMDDPDIIDVREIFKILIRKKIIISSITSLSFIFGCFYALSKPRIWQGQFQIVIAEGNNINNRKLNLGPYTGMSSVLLGNPNNISTQVEILKSPSVLMPIFKYVKDFKKSKGNNLDDWSFAQWRKDNIKVDLSKGTSIVNFVYRDENKSVIMDVLKKVSEKYKLYTVNKTNKNIDNSIAYLENQINYYKNKSINSLRKAGDYAITNELNLSTREEDIAALESTRVDLQNRTRLINQKLIKIKKDASIDDEKLVALAKANLPSDDSNLFERIYELDRQLFRLRSILKENDQDIQRLLLEKKNTLSFLKNRLIGYLKAEKESAEAKLISISRPKDTLLNYRALITETKNDNKTLISLQNELRVMSLEKARGSKPWEIISSPTLFDEPVGPERKKIAISFSILGFLIISFISLLLERFGSTIYNQKRLKQYLDYPIVFNIPLKMVESDLELIDIFSKKDLPNILSKVNKKNNISLINIGNIKKEKLTFFKDRLKNNLKSIEIKIKESIEDIDVKDNNFLIFCYGQITKEELISIRNKIKLNFDEKFKIIMFLID